MKNHVHENFTTLQLETPMKIPCNITTIFYKYDDFF